MINLDHAATTPLRLEALNAMLPYFTEHAANANALYAEGRRARAAIDAARRQIADAIHAKPAEIYFTGSGTEADNWALRGAAYAQKARGRHIITTQIEHHAVLHAAEQLEKEGFEVTYLPVDGDGVVSLEALEKALRPDTTLVSIMAANNEIGAIQPIREAAKLAKAHGALFHTDAVQAIGCVPIDVKADGIDLLSLSGHKFHAPKGVGALYIRSGVKLQRLIYGGAQEKTQRGGTENVASIVGMGKAIELAMESMESRNAYVSGLRDRLIEGILRRIPETRLNGHRTQRLSGNVNVSIRYIEGEALLLSLDMKGIAGSSGSACTSGSLDPSHVLLAIGLPHEIAHGSLRLSLSEENTAEEVDYTIDALVEIVERLRAMSPLYEKK